MVGGLVGGENLRRVKMRRKRGRRARAKKMGPPWWWMGESMR